MSSLGKLLMMVGAAFLVTGGVIWFRMWKLPHIAWGGFDWLGLSIVVVCLMLMMVFPVIARNL